MRAGAIHVTTRVLDVDGHHSADLCSIDHRDNAFAARESAEFLYRQHDSGGRCDLADEENLGTRGDGGFDCADDLLRAFGRNGDGEFLDDHAVTLCAKVPWLLAAGMFLVGHEDLVAGLEVE